MISLLTALAAAAIAASTPDVTPPPASSATPAPVESATAAASATATPAPTAAPLPPVLFRVSCDPRAACRLSAVGIATENSFEPIACTDETKELRARIAAHSLTAGMQLDLYARGATAGHFEVTAPEAGCPVRATGRKRNAPATVQDFVAIHPDDAVKFAALTFPSEAQTDAKAIARKAFAELKPKADTTLPGTAVELEMVRRFRENGTSVMAIEATVGGTHLVAIAEGSGQDASKWTVVWSSADHLSLVDAFDLGADGHAKVLFEKSGADGASEWPLMRRSAGGWH